MAKAKQIINENPFDFSENISKREKIADKLKNKDTKKGIDPFSEKEIELLISTATGYLKIILHYLIC